MENERFMNQVNKIQDFLNEQRAAEYPVENKLLMAKGEYEKGLYMRVLGMLIQCRTIPNKVQVAYLKRLAAGCRCQKKAEEFMKSALEITVEDVKEFLRIFKEGSLKYYFCIDGMILAAAGEDVIYELLAELIEALGIKKEELDGLALAARAVVEQDYGQLERAQQRQGMPQLDFGFYGVKPAAKGNRTGQKAGKEDPHRAGMAASASYVGKRAAELEYLLQVFSEVVLGQEYSRFQASDLAAQLSFVFQIYAQEHYAVLTADKYEIRHFYPMGREQAIAYQGKTDFSKEKVIIFENMNIDVKENWYFTDCKQVKFINCTICGNGKGKLVYARAVDTLEVSGCKISGFSNRFLEISRSASRLIMQNNTITDCGYETDKGTGGVIYINIKQAKYQEIILNHNELVNCYIRAKKAKVGNKVSGVFLAGMPDQKTHTEKLIMKNNRFVGCKCGNNGEGNNALMENLTVAYLDKAGNECNSGLVLMGD